MKDGFKSPGAEYRAVPFWSWNCRVTRELIDADLDSFVKMGFGGVCLHPRVGLDVEYLSEEYMDLAEYAAEGCEKRGICLWIYDDDRFPSGAAGGLVTVDGRHRQKYLRVSEKREEGYIACWEVRFEGDAAVSFRRLTRKADIDSAMERRGENRRVKFAYLDTAPDEPWFNGGSYIDVTDPEAVDAFIELTHERYYKRLKRFLGTTVTAFFTDEPRYLPRLGGRLGLRLPRQAEDFAVAYTPTFAKRFREETGLDALDAVPLLVWLSESPEAAGIRRKYREVMCESFNRAYFDRINRWCASHGVKSTGHILGEESLLSQTDTVGEVMRCYRGMDIPGIDVLVDGRDYAAALQASSVSFLAGKDGVMSELYGSTGWECPFLTYKLQGDWQAALGVTHRVPHLAHMSLEGEAKRDWPGSIFTQATWWERYRLIEDHFARLNSVLRRGERVVRVAVIHPVEAVWELPLCGAENERRDLSARFEGLIRSLLLANIDVCLVSEGLLAAGAASLDRFEAVVAPEPRKLRESTAKALKRFRGKVISGCDGDLCELDKFRDVRIETRGAENPVVCQLRRDGGKMWLFAAHTGEDIVKSREINVISVRGTYSVRLWDTLSGEIGDVPSRVRDGWTEFEWRTYYDGSGLFELSPRKREDCAFSPAPIAVEKAVPLSPPLSVTRSEPNALLLDAARFSLDGGELSDREEILRLDNRVRSVLGLEPRRDNMREPWATRAGSAHDLTLYYEFDSLAELKGLTLALERPELQRVTLNGEPASAKDGYFIDRAFRLLDLPPVKRGKNELVIRRRFDAKTNLEPMYLLGDFSVRNGALAPMEKVGLGDIRLQGLPYYTGNLTYEFEAELTEEGVYALRVPEMVCPLADVFVDGAGPVAALSEAPVEIGRLAAGRHRVRLTVYGSRRNLLGALHNAAVGNPWRGPDSWRTAGRDWSEGHILAPAGLLRPPEIVRIG